MVERFFCLAVKLWLIKHFSQLRECEKWTVSFSTVLVVTTVCGPQEMLVSLVENIHIYL